MNVFFKKLLLPAGFIASDLYLRILIVFHNFLFIHVFLCKIKPSLIL